MVQLPTVLVWLTGLTGLAWVALELRQSRHSRPEARHGDRGSRVVIGVAAVIGILLAIAARRVLPGFAIGNPVVAAWCGLGLLLAARALRQWSFWTLGRYFTFTVQTSADQTVIATGPYRFVRHPAYSALLLAAFSIASGEAARSMLFWMMGSLADATPRKVAALFPYALAGAAVLVAAAARLNLFSVGEENAAALGVDTERTKRIVFLASSLLTGVAVAFAGVIGFVGLLVPHAVRAAFGNDQRTLLPASFLVGATLVVAADAVARAAIAPVELPIGALTAALGAPVFAWLLLRTP